MPDEPGSWAPHNRLPEARKRVYTPGVGLLTPRPSPSGRDGAHVHSPNSCAPRMRKANSRRGRRGTGTGASPADGSGNAASAGRFTVDIILVRLLFVIVVAVTCFVIGPFGLTRNIDAGVGALIGAAIVLFEWKLRTVSLKRLIGAAIGSLSRHLRRLPVCSGHPQQRRRPATPRASCKSWSCC